MTHLLVYHLHEFPIDLEFDPSLICIPCNYDLWIDMEINLSWKALSVVKHIGHDEGSARRWLRRGADLCGRSQIQSFCNDGTVTIKDFYLLPVCNFILQSSPYFIVLLLIDLLADECYSSQIVAGLVHSLTRDRSIGSLIVVLLHKLLLISGVSLLWIRHSTFGESRLRSREASAGSKCGNWAEPAGCRNL